MIAQRIVLIQGHPDAVSRHLGHALEDAYAQGAEAAGHEVLRIPVAELDFPLLRSQQAWEEGALPASLVQAQTDIAWAQHLVLFFRCGWAICPLYSKVFWNRWPVRALHSKRTRTTRLEKKG